MITRELPRLRLFGVMIILVMFIAVDVTIRRLREKIEDTPSRPDISSPAVVLATIAK